MEAEATQMLLQYEDYIKDKVLARQKDFDELISGDFDEFYAITFVADPTVLRRYVEMGFKKVKIIIGDTLSKDALTNKDIASIKSLANMIEENKLQIYTPTKRRIHSKLYILNGQKHARTICGGKNLLESTTGDYVWYADLPINHPHIKMVFDAFEKHMEKYKCTLFMDDLIQLFRRNPKIEKEKLIKLWLSTESINESEFEVRRVMQEATRRSLEPGVKEVFTIELPEGKEARKHVEAIFSHLGSRKKENNQLELDTEYYRQQLINKHITVPLMIIDRENNEIRLSTGGKFKSLTASSLPEPIEVNKCLQQVEDFIETALYYGQTTDSECAKASYYETILYIFNAPFSHEWMKTKREKQSFVDMRGPRSLWVWGPGYNGKSILLKFAIKLLTMENIELLKPKDFDGEKIENIRKWGTVFPLVFDDFPGNRTASFEKIIKSHWETAWQTDIIQPQVIISSNNDMTKSWAVPRIKKIFLDLHFRQTRGDMNIDKGKEKVNTLISRKNPLFQFFSYLYLTELNNFQREAVISGDELFLARSVLIQLYDYAKRTKPAWFPSSPVEERYDPNRRILRDLLYYGKVKIMEEKTLARLDFTSDMPKWEIKDATDKIPARFIQQKMGDTVLIDPKDEFFEWIGEKPAKGGLFHGWFKKG